MTRLALLLATFGGVGFSPLAPGTAGSAAALAVYAVLRWAVPGPVGPAVDLAVIAALFAAGCWAGSIAERQYGRRDPGVVVVDEVMGMLMTLWGFAPALGWKGVVVGFLLFRLFDIVKPYPARPCEQLRGGLGIMADDAVAGAYANVALRVIVAIVPALR
jgi:phosphatidylglycerophosphatase A